MLNYSHMRSMYKIDRRGGGRGRWGPKTVL